MKIKLYQHDWNGINLAAIADDLGIPRSSLADSRIYAEFYRRLELAGFALPEQWVSYKRQTSAFMRGVIDASAKNMNVMRPKVLSIGAGLGIVEIPLIEEGYDIRLQECDERILRYLGKLGRGENEVKTESSDLSNIPARSYDMAYSVTVSYALDDDDYVGFLNAQKRIVRSGGFIVVWEFLVDARGLVRHLLNTALGRGKEGILWGFLRTPGKHLSVFNKAGLSLKEVYLMDGMQRTRCVMRNPPLVNLFPIGAFVLQVP